MFSFVTAITRPALPLVAAGAAIAALALPASASAASSPVVAVSVPGGEYLSIDSLSSTTPMRMKVLRLDADTVRVAELAGGTVQTGDGCMVVQDDDTVDCTAPAITSVHFEGSPFGDSLTFEDPWTLPVLANGWGGSDDLRGASGNDVLHGGLGHDTLRGAAGDDAVFGELGKDELRGGPGNDQLTGNQGADRVYGGVGSDLLRGGLGADRLFAKGDPTGSKDTVSGGAGTDRATLDKGVDTAGGVERRSF